ncbi:Vacuolar protein sorting-associated protein 52 homolog [Strongyloides ratti]|uniref:Vacuolar protein sorting-associated protein 52 homolog n=1 Tax=Strongyloides ratti TaxID=34506 RepID=A0A090LGR6_STRRB|nr:Vacuolar protein sorting-associated protein 52 homolog [Strongyloides ratti]CEF67313.1 Vacuolar protein sorting-associated protein 52 homolog [Strongyloides ratti]
MPSESIDINNDDDVVNLLEHYTDLENCSKEINTKLSNIHNSVVEDCINQVERLVELHNEINKCDQIFDSLENTLSSFLIQLGTIGYDMQSLQTESTSINQQLDNLQSVRNHLSKFIEQVSVSPKIISTITESDCNEPVFIESLIQLQQQIHFIKSQEYLEAKSINEVKIVVENLKNTAILKIREWILTKINSMKKPLSNYQIIQNALLKNKYFYEFLVANDKRIAKQIKEEYIDTVSKMFYSYFKTYTSRLFKIQTEAATKDDLLGFEDSKPRLISSVLSLGKGPPTKIKSSVFSLAGRHSLLTMDLISPIIVPHVCQQMNESVEFERIFRSVQYSLVDHASYEYLFSADFFLIAGENLVEHFSQVMGKSIGYFSQFFSDKIQSNHDAISLYICICLCKKLRQLLIEREINSFDGYWHSLEQIIWSRFEKVMSNHNESLRNYDLSKTNFTQKKQSTDCIKPHHVIRRYAEMTSALIYCGKLTDPSLDVRLHECLSKQQKEIELFISRYCSQLSPKEKLFFSINNYDMITSVLIEAHCSDARERDLFENLRQECVEVYVEEILKEYFQELVTFVKHTELLISKDNEKKRIGKVSMKRPILNTVPQTHYDNEMSEYFLVNEFEQSKSQKERLIRECNSILKFHEVRYRAALNFDDYKNWNCYIIGPPGTPYEGGIFFFRIEFDEEGYPQKAPRVFFETRIDHPCIFVDGEEMNKLVKLEIDIKRNSNSVDCYFDKDTKTIFFNANFGELTSAVGPDDWMRNTSVEISQKISLEDFLRIILSKDFTEDELSNKSLSELLCMNNKVEKLFQDKL